MSEVPPQSALIVEVPQAAVAVGRHRIALDNGCDLADMRDAERALQQHLPIRGHVGEVTLLVRTEGRSGWTKERTFPLA